MDDGAPWVVVVLVKGSYKTMYPLCLSTSAIDIQSGVSPVRQSVNEGGGILFRTSDFVLWCPQDREPFAVSGKYWASMPALV